MSSFSYFYTNQRLFQKKEGSRLDLFLEDEKPLLAPLPATRFELSDWKTATVQFNYHISVDGMLYSVPYEYIKKKVDVKVTDTTIEIFYNHNRIASHRRLKGRPGQYSTVTEHMPEDHQKYLEWKGYSYRTSCRGVCQQERWTYGKSRTSKRASLKEVLYHHPLL